MEADLLLQTAGLVMPNSADTGGKTNAFVLHSILLPRVHRAIMTGRPGSIVFITKPRKKESSESREGVKGDQTRKAGEGIYSRSGD